MFVTGKTNRIADPVVDLTSRKFLEDPYSHYQYWRDHAPIFRVNPGNHWAVCRYSDVRACLKNHDDFSSKAYMSMFEYEKLNSCSPGRFMVTDDPPIHKTHRDIVQKPFTPREIDKYRTFILEAARQQVEHTKRCGSQWFDFMKVFSYPFLHRILKTLIGIQDQDLDALRHWVLLEETNMPYDNDEGFRRDFETALGRQNEQFIELLDARRRAPKDDIASLLVQTRVSGQTLSNDVLCGALAAMVVAGFATTVQALNSALMYLAHREEMCDALSRSPGLIPSFVNELLRYSPPVHNVMRITTREISISKTTIPPRSPVLLMLASANRDTEHTRDADAFDLYRNCKSHLSFGHGIHTCLGEPLARLELALALEALLPSIENMAVPNEEDLDRYATIFMIGIKKFPIQIFWN